MKINLFRILGFFIILHFLSCASSEIQKTNSIKEGISVIEKVVIDASEKINRELPSRSTVALFNNSTDENELTNFVIEELHSVLTNKKNLRIVERDRIENLEREHKFQMETGYIRDDEIASIVEKLGAQYIVSCYITGNNDLQRLRIKTWNLKTGETITSSVFPTNEMGVHFIEALEDKGIIAPTGNGKIQTIRENGITIDITNYDRDSYNGIGMFFEIYIDNKNCYFSIDFYQKPSYLRHIGMWAIDINFNFPSQNTIYQHGEDIKDIYESEQLIKIMLNNSSLLILLSENNIDGLDIRNINIISRIICERIIDNVR